MRNMHMEKRQKWSWSVGDWRVGRHGKAMPCARWRKWLSLYKVSVLPTHTPYFYCLMIWWGQLVVASKVWGNRYAGFYLKCVHILKSLLTKSLHFWVTKLDATGSQVFVSIGCNVNVSGHLQCRCVHYFLISLYLYWSALIYTAVNSDFNNFPCM